MLDARRRRPSVDENGSTKDVTDGADRGQQCCGSGRAEELIRPTGAATTVPRTGAWRERFRNPRRRHRRRYHNATMRLGARACPHHAGATWFRTALGSSVYTVNEACMHAVDVERIIGHALCGTNQRRGRWRFQRPPCIVGELATGWDRCVTAAAFFEAERRWVGVGELPWSEFGIYKWGAVV